jgi:hypothetical protein
MVVASLLINLASLIGLVFVVGSFALKTFCVAKTAKAGQRNWKFTHNVVPSFACGALLATCTFLITPEAIAMLTEFALLEDNAHEEDVAEDEDHEDIDVPVAWRFGTCVIGGFLLPIVSSLIFPHFHEPEVCDSCERELIRSETVSPEENPAANVTKSVDETTVTKAVDDTHACPNSQDAARKTVDEECDSAGCDCHEHEGDVKEDGGGETCLACSLIFSLCQSLFSPKASFTRPVRLRIKD